MDKFHEFIQKTPFWGEVFELYDPKKEYIQKQEY